MNFPPHHPNMMDAEPIKANGLICWRDKERACGPDCMAFIQKPEGLDYVGQWSSCSVLVNQHRTGKHLTILASQVGELIKLRKNEVADRTRTGQPPPPKVI